MFLKFISDYFSPFAFFQSLIVTLYLFRLNKGIRIQNTLLAFYFLSLGITIGSRFIWAQFNFQEHGEILGVGTNFRFLIAPFFYLYIKSIYYQSYRLSVSDLIHALVFIIISLNHLTIQSPLIYNWKVYILIDIVQIFFYLVITFVQFNLIQLFIKPKSKLFSSFQIKWLRFFIIANVILWLYLVYSLIFENRIFGEPGFCFWYTRLIGFTNFICLSSFVYFALKFPEAFIMSKRNKSISDSLYQSTIKKMELLMTEKEAWKNPEISLQLLADETGVTPKQLSYIINRYYGNNFYVYINNYRIEACKKLLLDSDNSKKSILELAYSLGFNSKNSFNLAFKKNTGITPTEFRKRVLMEE